MKEQGFTLIEFAVVMAIIAILVSIATPSIITMMANADMRSTTSSLMGDLGTARAEALRSRQAITVCPSNAGTCGTDWSKGWTVFMDSDGNGLLSSADRIVRVQEGVDGNTTIAGPATFTFRSSGTVSAAGNFEVRNPKATSGRDLSLIVGGRVFSNVVNP
jgi:type IV fimbrial biogenesis protein FimT